jgi:hypothetical protein
MLYASGNPFRNRCPVSVHLLRLLELPRGTLCQPANPWIPSSRATEATSGHPLPTSKSLDYKLLGYWSYLGAPFANQQILGFQALGLLGLPRGILCQPANPWITSSRLLGLPRGTLCQPANPWITSSRATGATSGHPLPTSKPLDSKL